MPVKRVDLTIIFPYHWSSFSVNSNILRSERYSWFIDAKYEATKSKNLRIQKSDLIIGIKNIEIGVNPSLMANWMSLFFVNARTAEPSSCMTMRGCTSSAPHTPASWLFSTTRFRLSLKTNWMGIRMLPTFKRSSKHLTFIENVLIKLKEKTFSNIWTQ